MVYCAKSKTAKKRTWCKRTPCAVDSDNKSCILDGYTNRCRARISKKALPKKKSSKIIKKTKKTEEVAEVLPAPPLRRSARLNTAKGGAPPPKPMSKKASRAKVFNNKDLVTPGGLSTKDLVKSNGRIVSKVKSKNGKKNSWALAVKKARKELKIDGFAVIKKGEPIYDLAMKYYKGSVGGSEELFLELAGEDIDLVGAMIDGLFFLIGAIWKVVKYHGKALFHSGVNIVQGALKVKPRVALPAAEAPDEALTQTEEQKEELTADEKIAKLLAELKALRGEEPGVVQGHIVGEEKVAPEWIKLKNGKLRRGPGNFGEKRLHDLQRPPGPRFKFGGESAADPWDAMIARTKFLAEFKSKLEAMRKEAEAVGKAAKDVINQEGISEEDQYLAKLIIKLSNHTTAISNEKTIKSDVEQNAWLKELEEVKKALMTSPQEEKQKANERRRELAKKIDEILKLISQRIGEEAA